MPREDYGSNSEADAGAFEHAMRGERRRYAGPYQSEDVPTKAEVDADEAGR